MDAFGAHAHDFKGDAERTAERMERVMRAIEADKQVLLTSVVLVVVQNKKSPDNRMVTGGWWSIPDSNR